MIGPKDIEAKILNKQRNKPMPRTLHVVLAVGWSASVVGLAMAQRQETPGSWQWYLYYLLIGFCLSYIAGNVYGVVRHRKLMDHYNAERDRRVALIMEAKRHG